METSEPLQLGLSLAYATLVLALVGLLLLPRPRRRVTLALSAFVFLQAGQTVVSNVTWLLVDREWAYTAAIASRSLVIAVDVAYLAFLREALPIPLLKPLRSRAGGVILAASTTLVLAPFLFPRAFLSGFERAGDHWHAAQATADLAVVLLDLTVLTLGVVCALLAVRASARGTVARSQARAYAAAFLVQDVTILGSYLVDQVLGIGGAWSAIGLPAGVIGSTIILGWALLKYQLFDFELRVKIGIRRGTVVGIFLAVFLVVAEIASNFLAGTQGYLVGGLTAGLMLFAIRPLERLAQGFADRAMPGVDASPAYAQFKKLEVYRAAVETALEGDGRIDESERRMLDTLRAKLAIHADDARALEDEVGSRSAA